MRARYPSSRPFERPAFLVNISKHNQRSDLNVVSRRPSVLEVQNPARLGQTLPKFKKHQLWSSRRARTRRKQLTVCGHKFCSLPSQHPAAIFSVLPRFFLGSSSVLPRFFLGSSSVLLGSSSVLLGSTGLPLLKNCFRRNFVDNRWFLEFCQFGACAPKRGFYNFLRIT